MCIFLPQLGNKWKTPVKVLRDSSPWISQVSAKFVSSTNCPFILVYLLTDFVEGKPWKIELVSPCGAKHSLAYCPVFPSGAKVDRLALRP